jgi:Flp pilus assembly protein TadG
MSKGQSMVEFAILAIPAMIVLFIAIQFAIVARDSMALGQLSYQAARWAAAPSNSATDCNGVLNFITTPNVAPQPVMMIINQSGISCGSGTTLPASPSGVVLLMICPGSTDCTSRTQGSQVQIELAMPIARDLFLGQSFLGVAFPSTLSAQTSALTQG